MTRRHSLGIGRRLDKLSNRPDMIRDDEGQEILIRYKGDATPERYEFIRDYLDFKLQRLKPKGS